MWIRVKDRLPEFNTEVMTFSRRGHMRFGKLVSTIHILNSYWISTCQDSCGCCSDYDEEITHWQPLPEVPSE